MIIKIDASSLKYSACMRKFFFTTVCGYRSPLMSVEIEYGSAYHKYSESLACVKDNSATAHAIGCKYFGDAKYEKPDQRKEWYNAGHLIHTFHSHIEFFGENFEKDNFEILAIDGKPLVEQKFAIPIYKYKDTEILLCGTIDKIGKIYGGRYCIGDIKTTATKDPRVYFHPYHLSTQLITYFYAIKYMSENLGAGNLYEEMIRKNLGCFIDGVFLSKNENARFIRSEVFTFSKSKLVEFEVSLRLVTEQLAEEIESYTGTVDTLPIREGLINDQCADAKFGKVCTYFNLCNAPDEVSFNHILNNNFITKPYDPLSFR